MLYKSDWQLEQIRDYRTRKGRDPFFVSDWDCDAPDVGMLDRIVIPALVPSNERLLKYSYAEDQDTMRESLAAFFNNRGKVDIHVDNISVALNATNALYLCLTAIHSFGVNRFLVVTPIYYTVVETLFSLKATTIFHHLQDSDDFQFDLEAIEILIEEQAIDALIITDPIYSAGIAVSPIVYQRLAALCRRFGIWIICDHSLGGLHWQTPVSLVDFAKVQALLTAPKSLYIDSLTKRLFLNGVKHAVMIAPPALVAAVHDLASRVSGGFCSSQLSVMDALYAAENEADLLEYMDRNRRRIQAQYLLVKAALRGSYHSMYKSDTGQFTMICHDRIRIRNVDAKCVVRRMLDDHDLYVLPSEHFYYSKNNRFGFRLNLINDVSRFLPLIVQAVAQNADFLDKGS